MSIVRKATPKHRSRSASYSSLDSERITNSWSVPGATEPSLMNSEQQMHVNFDNTATTTLQGVALREILPVYGTQADLHVAISQEEQYIADAAATEELSTRSLQSCDAPSVELTTGINSTQPSSATVINRDQLSSNIDHTQKEQCNVFTPTIIEVEL